MAYDEVFAQVPTVCTAGGMRLEGGSVARLLADIASLTRSSFELTY